MDYFEKIKSYFSKRGKKKNIQDLISLFIIGLIAVIASSFFTANKGKSTGFGTINTSNAGSSSTTLSYEDQMKQELKNVLTQIKGAGNVSVMIYFDSSNEEIPAFNQNNSTKVTEENDGSGGKRVINENTTSTTVVTTTDGSGSKPFVEKELKPKISGVIVIAEGADNPDVKYKLYEAVKTVFGIEQYRVNIYPMKKTSS